MVRDSTVLRSNERIDDAESSLSRSIKKPSEAFHFVNTTHVGDILSKLWGGRDLHPDRTSSSGLAHRIILTGLPAFILPANLRSPPPILVCHRRLELRTLGFQNRYSNQTELVTVISCTRYHLLHRLSRNIDTLLNSFWLPDYSDSRTTSSNLVNASPTEGVEPNML